MAKVTLQQAVEHSRPGVDGWYYQFPEINNGTTVAYAEFTAEHGQRTIGDRSRIYYILEGEGEFLLNGETFPITKGDTIAVPPAATYNLWPTNDSTIKVILFMELLDVSKLPK